MIRALSLLALAGCGRYDFFALPDASDAAASCGHTFCDDFERTTVQGPWDSTRETNGMLAVQDGMLVATETTVMPATAQVSLGKVIGMATSHVHFEADYQFDTGTDGEIDLVQLHWLTRPNTCTNFGFFFVRDRQTNLVSLQETYTGCGGNTTTTFPGITSTAPSGSHHLTIDVTLGPAGTARVDAMLDTVPLSRPSLPNGAPASMISMDLGIANAQINTTTWTVRYDNVLVDLD